MKEGTLYFRDATGNAADSGVLLSSSRFKALYLTGAQEARFNFESTSNTANLTVVVGITFTGTFKDLCRGIAGALNRNTMTVVADAEKSEFFSYSGGTITGIGNVDDVNA
jgi:hypothetical protein